MFARRVGVDHRPSAVLKQFIAVGITIIAGLGQKVPRCRDVGVD